MSNAHEDVAEGLRLIFEGIRHLQGHCGTRHRFTIDGRLVGDIGELIAEREFEIRLDRVGRADYDAVAEHTGRDVQIKAGFKDSLTFKKTPDLYLGLRLSEDGSHEVIFNGPGDVIAEAMKTRAGFGEKLLSISMARLRSLNARVEPDQRIPARRKR
ncbi:hypothetical protein MU852_12285 [Brevundimonas albigilva]|uniref:DUF6998 domain-containing protein n=1 Tax=Brevundimonas albigilva TaxID=1312364 RepID=UPI00201B7048|nr:hypothetical protein [Brevundimonas albigilva]UQV17617.1 hypothetical protein MU852_12285 [Brevundimonas albigilva]